MLKQRIQDDVKAAMKAKDKERLGTLRLITAAIKQREVDERTELDDSQVLAILDKMIKQRRDSVEQYESAGRQELADQEKSEIAIIEDYLPAGLSDEEVASMIESAIQEVGAAGMQDMGKVMGKLKPEMQGRADMGKVSGLVKQKLAG
ncbi:MAG: GatB/YqeY domain-containing protein [Candidatus Thiodiazotropha weberae]|uniref:Glutamyl-tRNA amidotransferase n=1 Tax=Candidatus Thiodiazotropha endoloripes TaxID=1818881 RepID=A0A1E2UQT8_9GAMM|nr:GatB/YqeY domain-containing protein [Candidatus Thiodiazotropha endoloripes]MCG7900312.1 GatB/YqeY domain-containing protein [Candidatus Thiodiazotropha weberae]MCG7904674.1 GatB/YqeY domain-containing protein [Candidatus Thiodiazotropha weberae]MCG7915962.1 GatB/YqeY domain-containing protein [Candidatus Thiodiazotropha weberae]ODB85974.1 glutamyl-tRNA amidotransferase [Candidatus Thiodiazotropha endoloripes]ODB88010.1 glutamyl-tRNA amidotransferase [Candidatus Thiodiazotropha endoloripes]